MDRAVTEYSTSPWNRRPPCSPGGFVWERACCQLYAALLESFGTSQQGKDKEERVQARCIRHRGCFRTGQDLTVQVIATIQRKRKAPSKPYVQMATTNWCPLLAQKNTFLGHWRRVAMQIKLSRDREALIVAKIPSKRMLIKGLQHIFGVSTTSYNTANENMAKL